MATTRTNYQYISVPLCTELNTRELSAHFIDGSFLKPFEESARAKGLLGETSIADIYPLWFHFENERNIHLWKNGLSLSDIPLCRIWMNPLELLLKVQEKKEEATNPFSSPRYFSSQNDSSNPQESGRYYQALGALLEKSLPHLHALSFVAAEMSSAGEVLHEIVIAASAKTPETENSGTKKTRP